MYSGGRRPTLRLDVQCRMLVFFLAVAVGGCATQRPFHLSSRATPDSEAAARGEVWLTSLSLETKLSANERDTPYEALLIGIRRATVAGTGHARDAHDQERQAARVDDGLEHRGFNAITADRCVG